MRRVKLIYKRTAHFFNFLNSLAEPNEITRNLAKSFSDLLPQPSAMLVKIELDDRFIWLVKPNNSSLGKLVTAL